MRARLYLLAGLIAAALACSGCPGMTEVDTARNRADAPDAGAPPPSGTDGPSQASTVKKPPPPTLVEPSSYRTGAKGLRVAVLREGSGRPARKGDTVLVHYAGWLDADKQEFDSSYRQGKPFPVTLGQGAVIPGWEQGLLGMKPGEQRQLIIPPELAYGARGAPPRIPPNATLLFEVELVGYQ